jgi:pimeloyl-ACP methyl ester carboxylesterase
MGNARHGHVIGSRAVGQFHRTPGPAAWSRRTMWLAAVVAAVPAGGLLAPALPAAAGLALTRTAAARLAPAPTTNHGAPVPLLNWQACAGPHTHGFQCATARVPLDYTTPTGATIELAVIRHRAAGPGIRLGSVFFNSGGPGGMGTTDLPRFYSLFPAALRQRYDIICFDPRGIGESTAVHCFPTGADEARFFATLPAGFPVGAAQQHRWISLYARFGRLCEQRAGRLLPHIATADVARDMDLLRQAVGDPSLNYFGVSYGSYLGATYANLFPGEVGHMVLDGIVAPTVWTRQRRAGNVPLSTTIRIGSDTGQKPTLRQFLDLCSQAGTRRCAFSAGTPRATRAKYVALLRRLRRHPVVIAVPGLGPVTITYARLVNSLASDLFIVLPVAGAPGWARTASILQATWTASGGTPMLRRFARFLARERTAYAGQESFLAVLCADSPQPSQPGRLRGRGSLRLRPLGGVRPELGLGR